MAVSTESDTWHFDPTEEAPEDEAFAPLKFEIVNYPADITLRGYLDQWNTKQLRVPLFQRGYVWDQQKASKLIESFLLGLPVPGVFLFKLKNSSEFQIVDGQQRILSVIHFQSGKFDDKPFRLRKVQPKYEGLTFSDLSEELQFKLQTTVLRATIIQQLSPDDDTSIYQIFERLNTGGVNLNPMEIRQSVSYGPFIELIKKLNEDGDWRAVLGQKKVDKRLRDVELILRIFALFQERSRYEKPMKEFLNKYLEFKKRHTTDYNLLADRFLHASLTISKELGEKPFHLRRRLNYGLLDSIFVALMTNPKVTDLKKKVELLLTDKEYEASIRFNTSDSSAITSRFDRSLKVIS